MPTYDYRCRFCGPFSQALSIRDVTASSICPDCGEPAARVFSTPTLIDRTSPLRRAARAAEKSAHEPGVTTRTTATQSAEPKPLPGKLAGLPRP